MIVPRPSAQAARGYHRAADLIARHGRTYHLAASLLPHENRFAAYALYGFARYVDDIVDVSGGHVPDDVRLAELDRIAMLLDSVIGTGGEPLSDGPDPDDPLSEILAALADTVRRFDIPVRTFDAFLRSMRMDAPGSEVFCNRYRTLAELAGYTDGSAAIIGEQMLPILGVTAPDARVRASARALGDAFQLTNFLRDVAEDLDRDRIYLPLDELAAFGVDEAHLRCCRAAGSTSAPLRRALAHLIAVNRDIYRKAEFGIAALPRRTRPAIAVAAATYAEILCEIERSGYAVMSTRAVVSTPRKLTVATAALLTTTTDE
ncbi:phytoene synthase [Gordonia pseudamarae]|uniref:Phytoene synthase n=1 Tax=Gordonia pseudamarae TaxID=2831662 RepID=A0ABX6IK66_9ACTN|nr:MULTISPECIES: phytoene/squalene synthase family protein [Gordonia]MBD0022630.1 phytoene/squalene synthase family protein [Gordonia sp. (in: high G+C Gram-positive bacteria)]QHN26814.1 phytoene synthase [Gordonia pseudamarae]QHN35705.1 phytoene synthase [Gordonia pseudamarae]